MGKIQSFSKTYEKDSLHPSIRHHFHLGGANSRSIKIYHRPLLVRLKTKSRILVASYTYTLQHISDPTADPNRLLLNEYILT